MTKNKTNIFFIHTPFQLFIAEQMIDIFFSEHKNILFSEISKGFNDVSERWGQVIYIDSTQDKRFGFSRWKKFRKCKTIISNYLNKFDDFDLFVSDIFWPINNFVFGKYKKKHSISIFQDGIGAYIDKNISAFEYFKMIVKFLLSYFKFSVIQYPFRGNQMGQTSKYIKNIYGYSKSELIGSESKKIEIPLNIENVLNEDKVLFLDQPYHRVLNQNELSRLRSRTLMFFKKHYSFQDIFFKPHYMSSEEGISFYKNSGFELLDFQGCIEKYFLCNSFKTIISYNSSALFNLKKMFGDKIDVIALSSSDIIQWDREACLKVYKIFRKNNIKIVEINHI